MKIIKYYNTIMEKKSMRASFIIYADLESSLEKMSTCYNGPEK